MGKGLLERARNLGAGFRENGDEKAEKILGERLNAFNRACSFCFQSSIREKQRWRKKRKREMHSLKRVVEYFETKIQLLEVSETFQGFELLERTFKVIEDLEIEALMILKKGEKEAERILVGKIEVLIKTLNDFAKVKSSGNIEFSKLARLFLQEKVEEQEERGIDAS